MRGVLGSSQPVNLANLCYAAAQKNTATDPAGSLWDDNNGCLAERSPGLSSAWSCYPNRTVSAYYITKFIIPWHVLS